MQHLLGHVYICLFRYMNWDNHSTSTLKDAERVFFVFVCMSFRKWCAQLQIMREISHWQHDCDFTCSFFLRMKDYWVTKGWVALTFLGVTRNPIEQWTQHTLVVCFVHEGERIYSFFIIGNIILCNESLQGALSFIAHIGCLTIAMFDLK